jgi:hypothetical protein
MDGRDDAPWVTIPEPLDRRPRLGPFASGRDAAKFLTSAAVGAVVSLAVAPWAGLPIVAVGGVVALWRPDGEPLDTRLVAVGRWALRRSAPRREMSPSPGSGTDDRAATVRLPDGRRAAVVRAAGIPLAFLPPGELAHQFERYRELLRSLDGGLVVVATSAPIHAGAIAPSERPLPEAERAAAAGYRELVELLARRRAVRQVLVAVVQASAGEEGLRRLEASAELVRGRLADLGVRAERLRGRPLADAARRVGWAGGGRGP